MMKVVVGNVLLETFLRLDLRFSQLSDVSPAWLDLLA